MKMPKTYKISAENAIEIEEIRKIVKEINEKIFEYTSIHPESKGMGTTLVVAILTKEYLLCGNIGDSSGFVMKNNKLHKVTYDHTLVNLLVSAGELTEEQAKDHPKKNVLMKALGANNPIDIDIFDCDMKVSAILLCSDGLTNMLDEASIQKVPDKVIKLIRKANNRGGTDNISIAYLIRDEEGE